MYWYNSRIKISAAFCGLVWLLSGLAACRPDNTKTGVAPKYFDLKGYFKSDSARLTKLNPEINKTVMHNGVTETKKVHIGNWGQELNLYIQSDINRPAWKNSYKLQKLDSTLVYTAIYPELKTRKIVINKTGDKIKWIMIINHTKNILYETNEKLSYFPDSLYLIQKSQQVRLMGRNNYEIKGVIEK